MSDSTIPETITLFDADRRPSRRCGDCQLCCKLLPVNEFDKPANCRCAHQRTGKGCAIYRDRPMSCEIWNCRWLVDTSTGALPRPDRAHYVVDIMPDFVTVVPHDGSPKRDLPVIVIWCDPAFRDAHKAASLREWIDSQRTCALIRYGSREAFLLAPPSVTGDGWQEQTSGTGGPEHTLQQKAAALGGSLIVEVENDGGDSVGRASLQIGGRAVPVAYQGKLPS